MRRSYLFLALTAAFVLFIPVTATAARVTTVLPSRTIAGDFDTDQDPFINDSGNIAAIMYYEQAGRAPVVIAPTGETRVLALPDHDWSQIHSFTNTGQMLVEAESEYDTYPTYLRYDSLGDPTALNLGTGSDGEWWIPYAMNDAGVIVGDHSYWHGTYDPDFDFEIVTSYWYTSTAYLWRPDGSKMQLESMRGVDLNEPRDINNAGWVVGSAYDEKWDHERFGNLPKITHSRAVLWAPNGKLQCILTGESSSAVAINDAGEIVGYTDSGPAVWSTRGKLLRKLPKPSWAASCRVTDINDNGVAVGYAYRINWMVETPQAIAWDQRGRLIELEPLPGDTNTWACHINNSNQIVGWSQPQLPAFEEPAEPSLVVWTVK